MTLYIHILYIQGKTVQVVPHITNAIGDWIERVATSPGDIRICNDMI